ncbi:hypothetical protein KJ785_01250 [Patescibacteria group bacterium]|nr:hypothetical protein [Patescibacteria group bacterium]
MSTKYFVSIEKFAERHFIKKFHKKYKRAWEITMETLVREFQSFDVLFMKSIAEEIVSLNDIFICKTEFRIAGTKFSRKKSGNRCIVALNKKTREIKILLVYHKNDIGGNNETVAWKKIIRENYEGYDFCK